VPCSTAITRTNEALARTQNALTELQNQQLNLPTTMDTYRQLHDAFVRAGGKA
jgi:hypothetical protein